MAKRSLKRFQQFQRHGLAFLKGKGVLFESTAPLSASLRFIQFCGHVYHGFMDNRAPVRAAALAYTTVLAIVPIFAIAVSISTSLLRKERETTIPKLIERFVASVAPMLAAGSTSDTSDPQTSETTIEIIDFNSFANKLNTRTDEVSKYLWSRLSETNRQSLSNLDGSRSNLLTLQDSLTKELNVLVKSDPIYDSDRFADVVLSKDARALLDKDRAEEEETRLNVLLLEGAYPMMLLRSVINRLEVVENIRKYIDNVLDYINEVKSGTLGVTAVLVLVFIAISLLSTIESTFNDFWAVPEGRTWIGRIVSYWAGLTLGPLLLLTALGLTSAGQFEVVRDWLEKVEIIGIVVFRVFIPFLILSLAFSALYLFLPNTKVDWRAAIVGGTVAGGLLQLNSLCSVVYGSRAVTYSKIYGSLAVVPLFLVGLYFSWIIILLGAQVAYVFQFRHEHAEERHAEAIHQRGREVAAIQLMTLVGRQFDAGSPPLTAEAIGRQLNLPFKLVRQILNTLAKSGLLLEVGESRAVYSPARPLDKIRSLDILNVMRVGDGKDLPAASKPVCSLAKAEVDAIENVEAQRSASVTVKDLVNKSLNASPAA